MARSRRRALGSKVASTCLFGLCLLASPPELEASLKDPIKLGEADERLKDLKETLDDAAKAAQEEKRPSEEYLAKRLVKGQLLLAEHDAEASAIVFLDLLENYPSSRAAKQSLYYL